MAKPKDNSLRKRAERLVNEGEYVRALELYRSVLASGETNPKTWYGIGYTYYKLGRYEQSKAALLEARAGGYWPARRMLERIALHNAESTPFVKASVPGAPPSARAEPSARSTPPARHSDSVFAALRQERRHRTEELIAFLDRLASLALEAPDYLSGAECEEVHQAREAHHAANEHLLTCRRAERALEQRESQAQEHDRGEKTTFRDSRALEEARVASQEAEAEEEKLRKTLRQARRRLAIRVLERRDAPPSLAHFVDEIDTLRAELAQIEVRLKTAAHARAEGRDPRRESGVGAAG